MKQIDKRTRDTIFKVFCSVMLCISLMCVMWMTGRVLSAENPWETNAQWLLGSALLCLGGYELLYFFYKKSGLENKFNFAHIAYSAYCVVLGVLTFATGENPVMFAVICGIYFLFPISKRVVSIFKNHKVRNIIFNVLCIGIFTALLAITVQHDEANEAMSYMLGGMLTGTVIAVTCLAYILELALSHINYAALKKVIRKTYAGEILFGLLLLIIAFSVAISTMEPNINTFADALWYCFAIVTTIGFGDIKRAEQYGKNFVILSIIFGCIGALTILAARPFIIAGMGFSDETARLLHIFLFVMSYYCIMQSLNTTLIVGVFRAGGDTKFGLYMDTGTMWGVSIPLGCIAAFVLHLPPEIVFIILMSDEILKVPLALARYRKKLWLKNVTRTA